MPERTSTASVAPSEAVGATRGRVLSAIRVAEQPIGVEDLAGQLQIHPNTVRFHTSALEEDGLVERDQVPTGGKGRPRTVFRTTAQGTRSGDRNYRLLAGVLVRQLANTSADPVADARAAGRAWGVQLQTASATARRNPTRAAIDLLTDMGFAPEPKPTRRPSRLLLRNCPFREAVDEDQDIICAVHHGILQALTGDQVGLEPLTTPTTCVVHLPQS